MSPIVYMPPRPHDCEPPEAVGWRGATGKPKYPEGTIWECDVCCSDWELEYEYYGSSIYGDFEGKYRTAEVIWNRLDD